MDRAPARATPANGPQRPSFASFASRMILRDRAEQADSSSRPDSDRGGRPAQGDRCPITRPMRNEIFLPPSSLVTRHSPLPTRHFPSLLSRFTRKCSCQRNGGYVTCWAVRLLRIVSEVFLHYTNGLDSGHSTGHAGQPVPSRNTEQLIMHQEAIGEAFHPAQTGSITLDAGGVSVPFTVYAGTDFREVATRSADIR